MLGAVCMACEECPSGYERVGCAGLSGGDCEEAGEDVCVAFFGAGRPSPVHVAVGGPGSAGLDTPRDLQFHPLKPVCFSCYLLLQCLPPVSGRCGFDMHMHF